MKIFVYFKNYLLGYLTYEKNSLLFNSNKIGEKEFLNNCFSSPIYPLFNSANKELSNMPDFLQNYVEMTKNEFFINKAQIKQTDNEYEKLYKLSGLNFDDTGFYITKKMRNKNE